MKSGQQTESQAQWLPALVMAACLSSLELSGGFGVLAAYAPVSPFIAVLGCGLILAAGRILVSPVRRLPVLGIAACAVYWLSLTLSAQLAVTSPDRATEAVYDGIAECAFFAVLVVLTVGTRNWWVLAVGITLPMAIIGIVSAANEFVLSTPFNLFGFARISTALGEGAATARHAGPIADSNFWGRFLVIGLAFGLALAWHATGNYRTRASGAAIKGVLVGATAGMTFAVILAIYLTGSRGTLLGAAAVVGAFFLAMGVPLRVLGLGLLGGLPLLAVPGVGSRLGSVVGLAEEGVQRVALDSSMLERIATQTAAARMAEAHPLTGVGPNGYLEAFPSYAASAQLTVSRAVGAHNLYLGLWAEIGLLGLIAFLGILFVGIAESARGLWISRQLDADVKAGIQPYAAAALAGLIGWLVTSVFLHMSYVRVVLVVVAFAAAIRHQTESLLAVAPARNARPRLPRMRWRSRSVILAAGCFCGALLAVAIARPAPTYAAEVVGSLRPQAESTYLLSLRTRSSVVPTYAVLVGVASGEPVARLDAQGDNHSGLLTLTSRSPDPDEAARVVRRATILGDRELQVTGLARLYLVTWGQTTIRAIEPGMSDFIRPASIGGLLGGLLAAPFLRALVGVWRRTRVDRLLADDEPG